MESPQKVAWIQRQIRRVMLGSLNSVVACPYCGSEVIIGEEKLCCAPMGDATAALLHRMEAERETAGFALYPHEAEFLETAEFLERSNSVQ